MKDNSQLITFNLAIPQNIQFGVKKNELLEGCKKNKKINHYFEKHAKAVEVR